MFKAIITSITILIFSAYIVLADNDDSTQDPLEFLIWAASDPVEESEAGVINPVKFFQFFEKHRKQFREWHDNNNFLQAGLYLSANGEDSGTEGVAWPAVVAKFAYKNVSQLTEDKEHGLPSLIVWVMRNGSLSKENRSTLVTFIFAHKMSIIKQLRDGDVDGLISFLEDNKENSGAKDIDWKPVINDLKDNRQLFKFACGLFGLQLCDNL